MVEVVGEGNISAKIVADSVSPNGKRITTFELNYPRFIHAEFMTHRMFSRNAASSRAIPVPKMIENIKANTAKPIHWGANQKGMQADNECDNLIEVEMFSSFDCPTDDMFQLNKEEVFKEEGWEIARDYAIGVSEAFHTAGYHKQIVNRLLEPYQFIKVVCTSTEYDNFFWLRNHKDAQPEIKELAECMWKASEESKPNQLNIGEWHVPYYEGNYGNGVWKPSGYIRNGSDFEYTDHKRGFTLAEAQKISSSCCAQVSYRLTDTSVDKALKIYDMLVTSSPVHASPFEHQATPMDDETNLDTEGVTGYNRMLGYVSGNFGGWIQHRQLIPNHSCWNYEPE